MADIFVTLEEAAELEGTDYETIKKRIQRDSDNLNIIREPDIENGGRERVSIALSSLSKKARNLYRKRRRIDDSNEDSKKAPWYVSVDWVWYKENYKRQYNQAIALSKHIQDCIDYDGFKDKTEYIREYARELGLSERTFYRKIEMYTQASAYAIELNGKDNGNYEYLKILALCQKPRAQTGRTSLTEEMKAVIENIWFDPYFAANLCKYQKLYRKFCDTAKEKDWRPESLPSYITVTRYISDIREKTDSARVLLQKGEREYKRTVMTKARRDLKQLKVMELIVGDTHTFDCFVTVTSSNGKKRIVKPCLVGFMDMRSRCLVGWGICEIPNSQIIKEVLINMVMEKKNRDNPFQGVPRILLIDNGKDYTAETLTGRPRTVRVDLDNDVLGFYRELGIEKDMRSLPYEPWSKGQIERFFGTVCEDFSKDMKSYVGTLTGSKTSAKVAKNIKELERKGELLDINDFAARFEYWNLNIYGKREHGGLKSQKEFFRTPYDLYCNEDRYYKAAPPLEYLERLAMVRSERKVYATGIRLFDCNYMNEALYPYITNGKKVVVRYNPKDVSKINVYDQKTDLFICKADNMRLLNPLAGVADSDLEEHIRNQKRQLRNDKAIIAYGQMTYDERINAAEIEGRQKALVLPAMVGAKGQKIVSLPKDTNYLKDKEILNKQDERPEISSWLKAYGDKAFAELG